jgi:hypothetical protein
MGVKANRIAGQIIQEAEELLQTAKYGLEDMRAKPERRRAGLRNVAVFGRNTTWALQNLRGVVPEFDVWYQPKQEMMKADPLMRYFHDIRTQIEKKANTPTSSSGTISSFSSDDIKRFGTPPTGAVALFIGDNTGGSGWKIRKPDGSTENYYVELPTDIGTFQMTLPMAPDGGELSAQDLATKYLEKVEELVVEARQRFVPSD